MLISFKSLADQNHGFEVSCYEQQAEIGGMWNYEWKCGTDSNGELSHSSMYQRLFTNAPKECLECPNYTFKDHFGDKKFGSYPPRIVVEDYIKGRADKFGVRENIKFNTSVKMVKFSEETKKFTVDAITYPEKTTITEIFDYVVVATSHFTVPNWPEFPGVDTFPGRVMHSHDFKNGLEMKDKRVLIVGTSYSAEDIASNSLKYGAKGVVASWRTAPMAFADWPENYENVPLMTKVDGETVHFKDGTSRDDIDVILFATGFIHHFPFMEDKLKLKPARNSYYLENLWKGVNYEKGGEGKLFYMGMTNLVYTLPMFDV